MSEPRPIVIESEEAVILWPLLMKPLDRIFDELTAFENPSAQQEAQKEVILGLMASLQLEYRMAVRRAIIS